MSLKINKEINTTWIIPEKNILDINYTIKEEKKIEAKTENNNSYSQLKLETDKKPNNSLFYKKLNLNLNINRSNTRTKNNPIKKELSLEGNIIHSNTKIKNDKNKSDILKLKNFFFPVGNIKSENTTRRTVLCFSKFN